MNSFKNDLEVFLWNFGWVYLIFGIAVLVIEGWTDTEPWALVWIVGSQIMIVSTRRARRWLSWQFLKMGQALWPGWE